MFSRAFESCAARDGLKDGAKVAVFGSLTVYPPRGNYQITVLRVKLSGLGDLMQKYLELKEKLEKEGLFDPSHKRALPTIPRRIGLITSEAGAVVHDMCTVITRRFPAVEIRLCPALVQGADAPATLISALRYFNTAEWEADVLIIARGGGSFEDLFCFNDEHLVREVASSKIPIISAVGHETDFTLCDFAADKRAGTPSIAAEIAVPVLDELKGRIKDLAEKASSILSSRADIATQRLDHALAALSSSVSVSYVEAARRLERIIPRLEPSLALALGAASAALDGIFRRLSQACTLSFQAFSSRLEKAHAQLQAYSPYGVLERGYSITTAADGTVVRDASALKEGDLVQTRFSKGTAVSKVVDKNN
jgi:exodeoxyribonuclease VII large subunit